MDLIAFLLVFTMFMKTSLTMLCYKCEPQRISLVMEAPLCEHFNYSKEFVFECDSSNMCFKRDTYLNVGNGLITKVTQRGCAAQTMSGDQVKVGRSWRPVKNIYDVYNETCQEDPSDKERITKTIHCYCSGDLCNSAGTLAKSFVFITCIILLIIR